MRGMTAMIVTGACLALPETGGAQTSPIPAARIELAQAVRPLVSGERVRVQKLARDIEAAIVTLNEGGTAPFQDPAHVSKWQAAHDRYRDALARYPQIEDEDVMAAAARLAELAGMIAFGMAEAARQSGAIGDVQARLAGIEAALRRDRAPLWLPAPFDEAQARAWVGVAATAKRTADAAIAALAEIRPLAHLPDNPGTVEQGAPYDARDIDRLQRLAEATLAAVGEALAQTLEALKTGFAAQDAELAYYRGLDPADPKHRMNAFLREGADAEIYAALDRHMALARSVTAYQRAFGREPGAASLAREAEVAALRTAYGAMRAEALGDSRLPAPRSTDPARLAIAAAILADPANGFGAYGPIVLTTEAITAHSREVSRDEIRDIDISLSGAVTLTGTRTTWTYAWDEFRFAAPIRDPSGTWHVWWITARNFSSGWERTPIGRWVSGAATQGDLILPENFGN